MGSNKVLKVALGKSQRDEQKPNLHLVSDRIKGDVGLFFTTLPRQAVQELFDTFHVSTLRHPCDQHLSSLSRTSLLDALLEIIDSKVRANPRDLSQRF